MLNHYFCTFDDIAIAQNGLPNLAIIKVSQLPSFNSNQTTP